MTVCIGIDVGGTKIAAGLAAFPAGTILARQSIPTRPERGGRAVLDDVVGLIDELIRRQTGGGINGIGVGVCELVDRQGRLASANCIHWLDQPVQESLS